MASSSRSCLPTRRTTSYKAAVSVVVHILAPVACAPFVLDLRACALYIHVHRFSCTCCLRLRLHLPVSCPQGLAVEVGLPSQTEVASFEGRRWQQSAKQRSKVPSMGE